MSFEVFTIDNDIHIVDGLFTHKEISELQTYSESKNNYSMCGDIDKRIYTFASTDLPENFDKFQLKILDKFKNLCNEFGIESVPNFSRIITNLFTINDFCDIHTDSPDSGNVTFLLYCNKEWHNHWSGETYFQRSRDSIYSISVLPKPGRLVITPSDLWHGSRAPTQFMRCKGRITMAFQCEELDKTTEEKWYNKNIDKIRNA